MQQYKIYWHHTESPNQATSCTIENILLGSKYNATIQRYYKDIPNRKIARKISFKKTVDQIKDKPTRKKLWLQYFKLTGAKLIYEVV